MTKRTGNAIHINPINTNATKNSGSNTMEKIIFVIPQVALNANPNIFPNTTSIMIINNIVNIIFIPLFLRLVLNAYSSSIFFPWSLDLFSKPSLSLYSFCSHIFSRSRHVLILCSVVIMYPPSPQLLFSL